MIEDSTLTSKENFIVLQICWSWYNWCHNWETVERFIYSTLCWDYNGFENVIYIFKQKKKKSIQVKINALDKKKKKRQKKKTPFVKIMLSGLLSMRFCQTWPIYTCIHYSWWKKTGTEGWTEKRDKYNYENMTARLRESGSPANYDVRKCGL